MNAYNEYTLVQHTSVEYLEQEFGWESVHVYANEDFAQGKVWHWYERWVVSYVAKGLLPYHGLGSGIKRALEQWPTIDFTDDHDGCLFTATVHRKEMEELNLVNIGPDVSLKAETKTGKRRESVGKDVGKDSGCLSGKTVHHHFRAGGVGRH